VYPRRRFTIPLRGGRSLLLGERTLVMGIINVTPDSFSDGGQLLDPQAAIDAGLRMAEEGADLLDIGGESTRPGAQPTPEGEERRRILPVIEALAGRVQVPISVDTYKASTADAALSAGASLVNDVSGLRYEPDLASVVARHGVPIVLMHTRGRSRDMYQQAVYSEVVDEVLDEVRESMAFAAGAGIPKEHMLVDPGLGFAKEAPHSFEVLSRLHQFAELGRPIVIGPSRKTFLTKPLVRRSERTGPASASDGDAGSRDWATSAAVTAAVLCGAHVVRVHAVKELAEVVRVADEIRKYHRDV
jgi:dihydropteroate synthase